MKHTGIFFSAIAAFALCLTGCTPAQPAHAANLQEIEFQNFSVEQIPPRYLFIVTNVDNTSGFQTDWLNSQAKTILFTHLSQNQYFKVIEQNTMEEARNEAQIYNANRQFNGTTYIITSNVSEFSQREGQISRFDLHLINPVHSLVNCSVQGEGISLDLAISDAVKQMTENVNTGTCRPMSFF